MTNKNNHGRRGSRKPLSDLLQREQLIRMRQHGMTYQEIARQVGYCERIVNEYAHTILPANLRGKQPRRKDQPPAAHYRELLICTRCSLQWSPRNPVSFTERLCLWCRFELAGINLRHAHETGLYQRILAEEQP